MFLHSSFIDLYFRRVIGSAGSNTPQKDLATLAFANGH